MAAKDRDLMALLETASPARGAGWLAVLTQTLNSDPGAAERAYAVYARLGELAGSPADDPRVEATAQAIVAAIPEPARQAIRFPDGDLEEAGGGFAAAFYADFAPAQAAAIRRAVDLMRQWMPHGRRVSRTCTPWRWRCRTSRVCTVPRATPSTRSAGSRSSSSATRARKRPTRRQASGTTT